MNFNFTTTDKVNTPLWYECNEKLKRDLNELVTQYVPETEIYEYINDMTKELRSAKNMYQNDLLYLGYDDLTSMPADARFDFVYIPTYIVSTIMMTAMCRYEKIAENSTFRKTLSLLLEASLGRKFRGVGYEEYFGYLDTLEIFAAGDTLQFIEKFPSINTHFTDEFQKTLDFLENEICTGKIKDMWSGKPYSDRGIPILAMFKR